MEQILPFSAMRKCEKPTVQSVKTFFAALLLSLLGVGSVHAQCSEIDATSFTFEVLESTSTITRISWTFEDFNDSFDNRIALEFGELNSGDRYRFESEGTDGTGEFSTSTLPAGNYSLNIRAYCSSNDSSELFDAGIGNIEVTESTPASCSFSVSDFTVNATDGTDDMPYDDMVDLNYSGGETLDSIHFIITETTTGWTDSTTVTYDVDESKWPVQFSYLTAGEYTISLRPYCSGQASALITNGNSWQFTISCTSEQASPVIDEVEYTPVCTGTTTVTLTTSSSCGSADNFEYYLDDPNWDGDPNNYDGTYTDVTPGRHTFTVVNVNNSHQTDTTFTVETTVQFTVANNNARVCENASDTLRAIVSAGTAPYTYQWYYDGDYPDLGDGSNLLPIPNGPSNYVTCIVTDANSCQAQIDLEWTVLPAYTQETQDQYDGYSYESTTSFHVPQNLCPLTRFGVTYDCSSDSIMDVNFQSVDGCDSVVQMEFSKIEGIAVPSSGTLDTTITSAVDIYDDGGNSGYYTLNGDGILILRAEAGQTLTFSWSEANIGDDDVIYIYDYAGVNSNMLIGEYRNGYNPIPETDMNSGAVTLRFVSGSKHLNSSGASSGFSFNVTPKTANCLPVYNLDYYIWGSGQSSTMYTFANATFEHSGDVIGYAKRQLSLKWNNATGTYDTVENGSWETATEQWIQFSHPGIVNEINYFDSNWTYRCEIRAICSEGDTSEAVSFDYQLHSGYLIPASGDTTIVIDPQIREFYVFDDGGYDGNYSNNATGSLTVKPADGYYLIIESYTCYDLETNCDELHITDDYGGSAHNTYYSQDFTGLDTITTGNDIYGRSGGFRFTLTSDNSVSKSGVNIRLYHAPMNNCRVAYNPKAERVQSYYEMYDLLAYGESSGSVEMKKTNHATGYVEYDTITVNNGYLIYTPDYSMDVQVRPICNDYAEAEWSDTMLLSACTPPSTLSVEIAQMTALQQAYATLTWEDVGAESYLVYYHKTGDNNWDTKVATASPYELEGLAPMTEYQAYVRSICSEGDTSYMASTTETFTTGCGFRPGLGDGEMLYETPTVFDFENVEEGELPDCWSSITYESYPAMTQFSDEEDIIHALQFKTNATSDHYAVMPMFDTIYGSMDKWVIHFTPELMNLENMASEVCAEDTATIIVGVMEDPDNAATFTAVQSVSVRKTETTEVLVPLRSYSGSGLYPAFKMPAGSGHKQTDLLVSNVFVIPDGHLEAPTNLRVAPHPTQSSKLVVSWDCDDSQCGYEDDGHPRYLLYVNTFGGTDSVYDTYEKSQVVAASAGDVLRFGVAHAFTGARYQAYGSWFNTSSERVDYIVPLYDNQTCDTIGDLADLSLTSYEMPWATSENYGSQMLILNSELGGMSSISAIAFRVAPGCDQTGYQNADIYMANTELTEFTTTGSYTLDQYVDYNTMTLVGNAYFYAREGWQTITLNDPFTLEDGKNLVIAVASNSGDMVNGDMTRFYLDASSLGKGLKLPDVYYDNVTSIPTTYAENPVTYRPQMMLFENKSCTNDTIVDSAFVCENASHQWRGQTITFFDDDIDLHYMKIDSTDMGTYMDYTYAYVFYDKVEGVGTDGCDSVYKLVITKGYNSNNGYYESQNNSSYVTSCGPYTWRNGVTYTESLGSFIYYESGCPYVGNYLNGRVYDTVPGATANGCDSIYGLNLTIDPYYTVKFDSTGVNAGTGMADQYVCQDEPDFVVPACTMVRDYYAFDGWLFDGDTIQPDTTLTLTDSISLTPIWRVDCETQVAVDEPNEFCGNSDFTYSWHGHSVNLDYLKANAEYEYLGDEVSAFTLHDTVAGAVGGVCDSVYTLSLRSDIASFNVTQASVCPIGYTWIDDSTYTQNVGADQYGNIDPSSMRYIIDSTNASCYTINALSVYIDTEWTNYDTITYYYIQDGAVYRTKPVCNDAYYNLIACDTTREGYDFLGWQLIGAPSADTLPAGTQADAQGNAEYYAIWQSNCTNAEVWDTIALCSNDTLRYHGQTYSGYEYSNETSTAEHDFDVTRTGVMPGECDSICHLNLKVSSRAISESQPDADMTTPLCYGGNGSITLSIKGDGTETGAGGMAPYQFSIDGVSEYQDADSVYESTGYTIYQRTYNDLPAGTYTVSVKDACGLEASSEITLTQPDGLGITIDNSDADTVCYGSQVSITADVSGGTGAYTYNWQKIGDDTNSYVANCTTVGTYTDTVTVTDANGCTAKEGTTFEVRQPFALTFDNQDTSYCLTETADTIRVSVTGGSGRYNYTWNNGNGDYRIVPQTSAVGTAVYSLTVTDAEACGDTTATIATVVVNDTLHLEYTFAENNYCYGAGNVTALTINNSGSGGTTYQWYSNGEAISGATIAEYTPSATTAGTFNYTVKAVSTDGCGSDSVLIATNTVYDTLHITVTDQSAEYCAGDTNVATLHIDELTGGSESYEYTWIREGGVNSTNVSSTATCTPETNEDGTYIYTVQITDASCSFDTTLTVATITVYGTSTATDTVVACDSTTWIDGNTYTESSVAMQEIVTHTLAGADIHGCDSTVTLNLTINETVHATLLGDTLYGCLNGGEGSFTVETTGGTEVVYQWYRNGVALAEQTSADLNISYDTAGTFDYSVSVTDGAGCGSDSLSGVRTVVYDTMTVSKTNAEDTLYYCYQATAESFNVNVTGGSGGYRYDWQQDGQTASTGTTATYTPSTATAGTYSYAVTVTDTVCGYSQTLFLAEVTVYDTMYVIVENHDASYCLNSTATELMIDDVAGGSGQLSYQWYLDGEEIAGATIDTYTPATTAAGTYTYSLKITDNAGCGSDSVLIGTITVYEAVTASSSSTDAQYCVGSTSVIGLEATAIGGNGEYSYEWIGINGTDTTFSLAIDTLTYTPSTATAGTVTYAFIVSSACNNDTIEVATITVSDTATLTATNMNQTLCLGQPIDPIVIDYENATLGDISSSLPSGLTVTNYGLGHDTISGTPTAAGSFTLTITAENSCANKTIDASITVNDTVTLTPMAAQTQTICLGNGITAIPIEYTNATLSISPALPDGLTMTAHGNGNDTIMGTPTNAQAEQTYTVTATDSNGCGDKTFAFTLTVNDTLTVTLLYDEFDVTTCPNSGEGEYGIEISTYDEEPTIQWYMNGEVIADLDTEQFTLASNDETGTFDYSVTVTDANGCKTDSLYVGTMTVRDLVVNNPVDQSDHYCVGDDPNSLFVDITSGSGNYTYQWQVSYDDGADWSNTDTTERYMPATDAAGTFQYRVVVTDNECGTDTTVTVGTITINAHSTATDTREVCDSLRWIDDTLYTENTNSMPTPPTYTYSRADVNGCDSVVTLQLIVNHSDNYSIDETACDSYTWDLTGETYTSSTDTSMVLTNAAGCDSTVILHLTMYYSSETHDTIAACDSYTWQNNDYDSTGVYTLAQETANGCDSTMYLNLTINHSTTGIDSVTTCDSVTWIDGNTYSSTMVAESPTYTYQNSAANGCDSVVTLHLTLAETYTAYFHCQECDTNFMPDIEVCSLTPQVVMPENEYEYEGHIFIGWIGSPDTVQPGDTVTISSSIEFWAAWRTECSNIDTVEYATICEGDSITWRGMTIDGLAQEYSDTVAGVVDVLCDSVYHLLLTVNYPTTSDTTMMACDSVWWNGMFFTETPDTTQSYFIAGGNQYGCDSTAYLNLTVNYSIHDYVVETACDRYTFDSVTYTESTDLPTIGDISDNGCPFITHISLTVNYSYHGEDSATACDMYVWNDMELTEGGDHDYVGYTSDGCDSVVTLHLTLHQTAYGMDTQTACDSLEWIDGNLYFSDFPGEVGEITYLFPGGSMYGCDSVAVLDLTMEDHIYVEFISDFGEGTMNEMSSCRQKPFVVPQCAYTNEGFVFKGWVNQVVHDTVQPGDTVFLEETTSFIASWTPLCEDVLVFTDTALCEGSTFVWRGYDYTNELYSGDYEDVAYAVIENYCDSIYYLRLTVYPISYNEFFDSVVGSLIWYDEEYTTTGDYSRFCGYNRYGCDSTEVLHLVVNLSIDDKDGVIEVKVYPNPTTGPVNLDGVEIKRISVVNMVGRTAATFDGQSQIDISDLPAGQYTLLIETPQGNTTRRIIKR